MSLEINITSTTTIHDVQQALHAAYPYLKIEFGDRPHSYGEPSTGNHWYFANSVLSKIALKFVPSTIQIDPWTRTGHVEEMFCEQFGLFPQIFRREGERWIQTYGTDIFSLEQQNEIGKEIDEKRCGNLWIEREII